MRKPLTYEQAMAIKDQCPAVETVGVEAVIPGPPPVAKYKGLEMVDANFRGSTPDFLRTVNADLQDGRLYTDFDDLHRRDVAVIGNDVVTRFFEGQDPIGKVIQVDGHPYEVIGALSRRKALPGNFSADGIIYVPYFTFRKIYPLAKENLITAVARPGQVDQSKDEITELLRRLRGDKPFAPNSFGIATAESIIGQFRDIMGMVVLVTVVISSIGLLVGGIGVMNIMLVSVTERTREIGVRKAIGARRSDITWQFLLEAMTLTATGGLLGILGGATLSYMIRTFVPSLPSTVPLWAVAMGFVASVSIGLFFGMWPALKASRLDPIVALRHE
jgi:ABC-type antimicrobial peptide transport system permease subunit